MAMLENGSGFALAMGLDGAVWRSYLYWYGSESESEAMFPFDSVGDHWERLRRCRLSVPNGGGSPLRYEEYHGGSIVFTFVYETGGYEIWTLISIASYWLKVVSQPPRLPEDNAWLVPHGCFYSIGRVRFPFHLEIPLSSHLLWGSCSTPHNEFLGKAQVLPTVEVVRDLCPQRMQNWLNLV